MISKKYHHHQKPQVQKQSTQNVAKLHPSRSPSCGQRVLFNLVGKVPCPYVSMGEGEWTGDSEMVALPASSIWLDPAAPLVQNVPVCWRRSCSQETQALWPMILWEMLMMWSWSHRSGSVEWNVGTWKCGRHKLTSSYSLERFHGSPGQEDCWECQGFQNCPFMILRNHGAKYSPFCSEIHVFFPMLSVIRVRLLKSLC